MSFIFCDRLFVNKLLERFKVFKGVKIGWVNSLLIVVFGKGIDLLKWFWERFRFFKFNENKSGGIGLVNLLMFRLYLDNFENWIYLEGKLFFKELFLIFSVVNFDWELNFGKLFVNLFEFKLRIFKVVELIWRIEFVCK